MLSSWVMLLTWIVFLKEFSVAQDLALEEAWRDWKKTYEKVYTDVSLLCSERDKYLIHVSVILRHQFSASKILLLLLPPSFCFSSSFLKKVPTAPKEMWCKLAL